MKLKILAALWVAVHSSSNGDKLSIFFDKTIKHLQQKIKRLKSNLSAETIKHEEIIENLDEQIEDAKQALEDSYIEIPEEALKTNASMNDFQEHYLYNISQKQKIVEELREKKEKQIVDFKAKVGDLESSISKFEKLIAKLSAEQE